MSRTFLGVVFVCVLLSCSSGRKLRRVRRGWLSAPASTGRDVTCAFNPCSVPNFCGDGRTCKMDDKCMHSCECDTGSKHEQCVETDTKTTTPPTIKCTFDPCSSAAFTCSGRRKCELGDFCIPQCVCTEESDHFTCIEKKENRPVPNLPTSSPKEDQCYACVHGECVLGSCKCHDGWQGDTCNDTSCTLQCNEGFDCHILPTSVQICIYNHSKHATSVTTTSGHVQQTDNVCNPTYVMRTLNMRTCKSGLTCLFGKCILNDGEEKCQCDYGATGDTCEDTCCLDCGPNMMCTREDYDIEERCECWSNYTGENCTEPVLDFLKGMFCFKMSFSQTKNKEINNSNNNINNSNKKTTITKNTPHIKPHR